MAVPKRKTSPMKRNQRRSHDGITAANWVEDSHTGNPTLRHHIDLSTGMYRGRQVIDAKD